MKKLIYVFSAVCLLASCSESPKEEAKAEPVSDAGNIVEEAKAAIAEQNKTYGDGFVKLDSSLFLNHYTSDACVYPPGSPALCGKEGLMGFYNYAVKSMGTRNITITSDEVFGSENAMVEIGQYELFSDSAKTKSMDKGKFIVAWKKENGTWKMHRDMFNSTPPPPPPPAPVK